MRAVNLIPTYYAAARRRRIHARRWTMGVLVYGTALLLGWGALRVMTGGAHRAVAAQLADVEARIADTEAALQHVQPRLAAALASLEAGKSVGDQPNWAILMRVAANLVGEEAVLTRFHLEPDAGQPDGRVARRYVLHLRGLARSHEAVSRYMLALESLDLFESVKLLTTRREPVSEQTAVAFEIDCTLGGAGDE